MPKVKECVMCDFQIRNWPNLVCGHFVCPMCYCKLQTQKARCPVCEKVLKRRVPSAR